MRLAYITNTRLPSEKAHSYQTIKMCEALASNNIKVLLCYPRRQQTVDMVNKSVFEYYGIKPIFKAEIFDHWGIISFFKPVYLVQNVIWGSLVLLKIRKFKPDLFYTRDIILALWFSFLGLPTVFEEHVIRNSRLARMGLKLMANWSSVKLIVVLTAFIKNDLMKLNFPENKILVLPDAVDLSLFANLPEKNTCRKKLNLPQEKIIIGYVGRFRVFGNQEKGIPQLIEAVAKLFHEFDKQVLLLLVGGPTEAFLFYQELASQKDLPSASLRFVSQVPATEVPHWMKACDIVTIPWPWTEFSAYSTSPLKLFEYMAAGVPIVASDLPSIREILEHKKTGWLATAGNPQSLADGLQAVFSDQKLRDNIAQNAKMLVRQFTWGQRAERIKNFLMNVK